MSHEYVNRRAFLARVGVIGALAAASVTMPGVARALTAGPTLDPLKSLLAELAKDTLNGLTVFVAPGPDAYSAAQGTARSEPGAMEAKATDFLIESLDGYVPLPDQLSVSIGQALADGLADVPLPVDGLLNGLDGLDGSLLDLDGAVRKVLRNDESLPLSLVVALLLNAVATTVNPASVTGPFLSPFARLSFEDKAAVFEQLEGGNSHLVAALDDNLPGPLRGTASGMLQFISGALLEFSAFGTFSEWSVYDPETKWVSQTPAGWSVCGYDPGVMDGWDEFKGYYQGRQKVSDR